MAGGRGEVTTGPIGPGEPTAEQAAMRHSQAAQDIDGWIEVGTGEDKAFHGFDVEAKAEHHGRVYGKYDARTQTVLSMDGRIPVTYVRPADGSFRATSEYAADLQQGNDTHRF